MGWEPLAFLGRGQVHLKHFVDIERHFERYMLPADLIERRISSGMLRTHKPESFKAVRFGRYCRVLLTLARPGAWHKSFTAARTAWRKSAL
jgi:hypothetical protein